jgi:hypothetical protein
MRSAATVALIVVVIGLALAVVDLRDAAEGDFSLRPNASGTTPLTPRCFALKFDSGFAALAGHPLPTHARLTTEPDSVAARLRDSSWYRAQFAPRGRVLERGIWRRTAQDSADVVFHFEWYEGVRVRLPIVAAGSPPGARWGRAKTVGDVYEGPLAGATGGVLTVSVPCDSVAF